jgi:hypothetical protein
VLGTLVFPPPGIEMQGAGQPIRAAALTARHEGAGDNHDQRHDDDRRPGHDPKQCGHRPILRAVFRDRSRPCTKIVDGTVSERPKVQLSKSCVGESPPWVQIPPVPPIEMLVRSAIQCI